MPKSLFTGAYASFLEVLIAARKGAGVSQVELGSRLGKPQTWVSSYERGVRRLDVIELYAIERPVDAIRSLGIGEVPSADIRRTNIVGCLSIADNCSSNSLGSR